VSPFSFVLLGFVINPIAGMGGSVALKGTDGDAYRIALSRGAVPLARGRVVRALSRIDIGTRFLTASGEMGAGALGDLGLKHEVVWDSHGGSAAEDTRQACRRFEERDVDLIVFCGGDGTARDVLDSIGDRVPVIGIPSGVKMHSAVFANTPEEAGDAIVRFARGGSGTRLAEVMDVDEDAFRRGELRARLYGYVQVPEIGGMQPPKGAVFGTSDEEQKEAIAEFLVEHMEAGTIYVLGPGTSTKAVADRMGQPKTLLGVDAYLDGNAILTDASEEDLLRTLEGKKVKIVVTPIGRQGFIFGRGNQQLSPKVIDMAGLDHLVMIATPTKLAETPVLHSDSGDIDLDARLSGYRKVLIGYDQYRMVRCR
jgi:predicted polyphosphate/ATP-dependent NAD kinase